ncbi:hypothetical protein I7X12_15025 [Halosimplex litoreum]|uniref:Uncharacterized protein n=1 Tax=Halosimplex litoreum TaxID=1198301 RepID=A0A7T3FWH8_9EURY|nr:hypothetical protein [Halosimplex litoreum]QPV62050.1 hypothetical protein I7X12_15025 [Halosimplex litoreum]
MPGGTSAVDLVCAQRDNIPIALAVMMSMGALLVFSFVFVSPGDEAFVILVIDAVLIGVSTAFFIGTYYYCTKRAMDD